MVDALLTGARLIVHDSILYDRASAVAAAVGVAAAAEMILDAATKGRSLRVLMLHRNNGDSVAFVIG
ncbi:MAG: hypothetical protein HYW28_09805 [Rhodospirillales bacterium]|nr:hypothetical protein [Rhodospirillales bacterium]